MKTLVILNDAPYGSERTYNGMRLAGTLSRSAENEVRVFLLGMPRCVRRPGRKFQRASTTCC